MPPPQKDAQDLEAKFLGVDRVHWATPAPLFTQIRNSLSEGSLLTCFESIGPKRLSQLEAFLETKHEYKTALRYSCHTKNRGQRSPDRGGKETSPG